MRLHRLSMTAIGPFAGDVGIDFTRLGQGGLFLLEGPTGAGKSTVIDAISFALYGKVAQASAHADRLRSHHADEHVEPVVELVFETHNGVYRVRRTPSYDRRKKSGDGVRRVNGTVKIWRLTSPDAADGECGEPLSTRVAEADDEIARAVGLSHDQFVQTIVLPQGEFANFLRAKTDDKKQLLQRLFGTELVARTQQSLVEGRRAAEQRRAGAAQSVHDAVRAFIGAAGVDADGVAEFDAALAAADSDTLLAAVKRVLATLAATRSAAEQACERAIAARTAAQADLDAARDLSRRRARRAELLTAKASLEAQRPDQDGVRAELAAAERALTVIASADALAAAITRSDAAQRAEAAARAELKTAAAAGESSLTATGEAASAIADGLSPALAGEPALRGAAGTCRTTLGALADDLVREDGLARLLAEQAQAVIEAEKISAAIETDQKLAEQLPDRVGQLRAARDEANQAAAAEPTLAAELGRAQTRLAAAEQAERAQSALTRTESSASAAMSAWQAHEESLGALRARRVASIAGELGLRLRDGEPCDVCGSIEHPQPARPGREDVSQDDVERAEAEASELKAAAERARDQLAGKRTELAELRAAAEQQTPEQARARCAELAEQAEQARDAAQRSTGLGKQIAELERQSAQLGRRLQANAAEQSALAERLTAMRQRVAEDERRLGTARGGFDSVADRVVWLTERVELLERAASAVADCAAAVTAAQNCGDAFVKALREAEFDDEPSWRAARRDSSAIADLRAAVKAFDDAWAATTRALAEPELSEAALDGPMPDLASLRAALSAAQDADEATSKAHGSAIDRLAAAEERSTLLRKAVSASASVLAETAPAIRLGNLVAGLGDNQLKMELTTYVLVRRFADIVAAANGQLRRMSSGRYQLEHTDARSGNARSGLGLRVLDLHTGRARDPATLSGGETFYVSLSLALGLADVVRAESGGIDLGTLFVDEGFGTLDPDVLDQVLGVLDGLREGGRCVGIVSHVAELKAQIADRVEVRPNPDGSSRLRVLA